MKNHPHLGADKVRFAKADARRVRREIELQHAREQRLQELWIRFKRQRDEERAGGGIPVVEATTQRKAA